MTPDTEDALADLVCRRILVPDSPAFRESVSGALLELTHSWNWEQYGTMTPDEAASAMLEIYNDYMLNGECTSSEIPTPFWDDATDLDDQEPAGAQSWYGYVDEPDAEPAEITFFESAAIWTITGLLAISGNVGAAILYHTIAPRFAVAVRTGDVGEIIRILFDGEEQARIDTAAHPANSVVRVPVVGDASLSTHELLIIKAS